jgi:hypothetical protein
MSTGPGAILGFGVTVEEGASAPDPEPGQKMTEKPPLRDGVNVGAETGEGAGVGAGVGNGGRRWRRF